MDATTLGSPEQQEVFQRVWARVMGQQEGAPAVPTAGRVPDRADPPPRPPAKAPCPAPAGPTQPPAGDNGATALLRRQTLAALEGWQCYRFLARRSRGGVARTLGFLAADQHRQARRLAAAYFLRTGVRYWPTGTLASPAVSSLWGALRRQYQAEQAAGQEFLDAARHAGDPELERLYQQLAHSCQERCRQLRTLLERTGL